jgi:hypothetical protein
MENYNYYEAVKEDIRDYINNEIDFTDFENLQELEEYLNETLWVDDSVTGNGSGSYTFNIWRAQEYLSHNWDLLAEALEVFGQEEVNAFAKGAEWCDVTIRCYLLNQCISEVLEEIGDEFDEAHESDESDED